MFSEVSAAIDLQSGLGPEAQPLTDFTHIRDLERPRKADETTLVTETSTCSGTRGRGVPSQHGYGLQPQSSKGERMMERVLIVGTGLIGASLGMALKAAGFAGHVAGWDQNRPERLLALDLGAVDEVACSREEALSVARHASVVVLALPVLAVEEWLLDLAPILHAGQLVTDTGSTKLAIAGLAAPLFNLAGKAAFLPGHPMAGKEAGGAARAEAALFHGAAWLFTPDHPPVPIEVEWRRWIERIGACPLDLDPADHDQLCGWVSHLPQMLSTAFAALLEDRFGADAAMMERIGAIGGRALRETTRLGASPYTMWRDVALSNTDPIAETLLALEQRLAHLRENLRTPGLRDEFALANRFRERIPKP